MRSILSLLFLVYVSPAMANLIQEQHHCETDYQNDRYNGYQFIKIDREKPSDNIQHVYFEKSFSYFDFLVYKRATNELMGDRAHLPIPPFDSFEIWSSQCQKNPITQCDMSEYLYARKSYESDSRWVLETYEIAPNDPNYFVEKTHFVIIQSLEGDTKLIQNSGYDGRYSFKEDVPLSHKVFITNSIQNNYLYINSSLWGFFEMVDGPRSYSPFLQVKLSKGSKQNEGPRITVPCSK